MFNTYTAEVIDGNGLILGSRIVKIWFFKNAVDAYRLMLGTTSGRLINFRKV